MFHTNDEILRHINGLTSEYDHDKAVYLYNRVCNDAETYCGAAALVDFTTMSLAAEDGRDDVRRLLAFIDHGATDDDTDRCEYLFTAWVFELIGTCHD